MVMQTSHLRTGEQTDGQKFYSVFIKGLPELRDLGHFFSLEGPQRSSNGLSCKSLGIFNHLFQGENNL